MAYYNSNVFAQIISGVEPASFVYRHQEALAFLDTYPISKGHTLVIPTADRAVTLLDLPEVRLVELMRHVRHVASLLNDALRPDGIELLQFSGSAAGQSVFHLHFHIVPRWHGLAAWRHGEAPRATREELDALAAVIRASSFGQSSGC